MSFKFPRAEWEAYYGRIPDEVVQRAMMDTDKSLKTTPSPRAPQAREQRCHVCFDRFYASGARTGLCPRCVSFGETIPPAALAWIRAMTYRQPGAAQEPCPSPGMEWRCILSRGHDGPCRDG